MYGSRTTATLKAFAIPENVVCIQQLVKHLHSLGMMFRCIEHQSMSQSPMHPILKRASRFSPKQEKNVTDRVEKEKEETSISLQMPCE